MKQITKEWIRSQIIYDEATGICLWKEKKHKRKMNTAIGTLTKFGYLIVKIDYVSYYLHRLVWVYVTGEEPKNQVDHINGIKNDNRWINLRDATPSENSCNRMICPTNTSGYKGVDYDKKRKIFRARVTKNKISYHLGWFSTGQAAYDQYCKYASMKHDEFVNLGQFNPI